MNELRIFVGLKGKHYHLTLELNGELLSLPPAIVTGNSDEEKLLQIMIDFIEESDDAFDKNVKYIFYVNDFDTYLDWKVLTGIEKNKYEVKCKEKWNELFYSKKMKEKIVIVNNYMSKIGEYYEK